MKHNGLERSLHDIGAVVVRVDERPHVVRIQWWPTLPRDISERLIARIGADVMMIGRQRGRFWAAWQMFKDAVRCLVLGR